MAKRSSSAKAQQSASAFDALVSLRKPASQPDGEATEQPDSQPVKRLARKSAAPPQSTPALAKSVDPDYIKFTTYVRKGTHRAVKVKLTERDAELSDLVEQLLTTWLQKNK